MITIDAIGTQKQIASQIIGKQADYLFEVKGNQPTLMKRIEDAIAEDLLYGDHATRSFSGRV